MRLPKWLQPIKDQTLRAARHVLRAPPREPTLEEFTSPLRDELKTQMAIKPDIGYNPNCTHCRGHRTVDAAITHAVQEHEDPQPWLESLHGELIATREDLTRTQRALASARKDAEQWKNPLNRIQWLTAGGVVGIVFFIARELVIQYALPLIFP